MVFTPQNFRLTSRSRRTYQLVVDGGGGGPGPPGPQGPPGPNGANGANGAGIRDYDDTGVDLGINFTVFGPGNPIFRVVVPIAAGPNNNEITVAHGASILTAIEIRGVLGVQSGDWFPLPWAASPVESTGTGDITLRVDATNVYISSTSNLSGLSGFVIIDYLEP